MVNKFLSNLIDPLISLTFATGLVWLIVAMIKDIFRTFF